MKRYLFIFFIALIPLCVWASPQNDTSKHIKELKALITKAKKNGFDTKREECTLWMADTFLGYAKWDEKNVSSNVKQFQSWSTYKNEAQKLAEELPGFERSQVDSILMKSIIEIKKVLNKEIVRKAVPSIDWNNIKPYNNNFKSDSKPVFINDYFTKTPGYDNDYCGSTNSVSMSLGNLNSDGTLSWTGGKIKNMTKPYSGYVMLWHGVPPKWALEKYSNLQLGKRTFTFYDIDNPNIRSLWENTFKIMIPYTKDKPFTNLGYILSNEPHWFTLEKTWATGTLSHYSMDKFKVWLRNKHKNISRLNSLWKTNYDSFDSITFKIPFSKNLLGTPAGYDWQRFNMDRVNNWFQFLHDGIKKYDPQAKTHIKIMPELFVNNKRDHGIDLETLTNMSEIIGNDAKICKKQVFDHSKHYWEGLYSYDWKEVSFCYDFLTSVSPDKPMVNSESHFLSSSRYRDLHMTPDFVRSSYWLSMLHGMDISFSWFWARENDGSIRNDLLNYKGPDNAMKNAYVASVVQQPAVANEVARTYMDANAFADELAAFQQQKKPLRIFYSETSAIDKVNHMDSLFDIYRKLNFNGVPIGFVTENIIDRQDRSLWDVVLVRQTEYVTDKEFNALQRYLDNGGTIIIDKQSLSKNEYGEPRANKLNASKGKILIAETDSDYESLSNSIMEKKGDLPEISIKEDNKINTKGCFWREIKYNGSIILTVVNLGNDSANLEISMRNGRSIKSISNLMNGTQLNKKFTLSTDGILLLKIE